MALDFFTPVQNAYVNLEKAEEDEKRLMRRITAPPVKMSDTGLKLLVSAVAGFLIYGTYGIAIGIAAGVAILIALFEGPKAIKKQIRERDIASLASLKDEQDGYIKEILTRYGQFMTEEDSGYRLLPLSGPVYCDPRDLTLCKKNMEKGISFNASYNALVMGGKAHQADGLLKITDDQLSSFLWNGSQRASEEGQERIDRDDRQYDEKQEDRFSSESEKSQRNIHSESKAPGNPEETVFFKGIHTKDELKTRYRSLMKAYHPDEDAGDDDTVKQINMEYSALKEILT